MRIIQNSEKSVGETAEKMHWDLRENWEDFTNMQKWFAAGEAMAHLEHLVATGLAVKNAKSGTLFYKYKEC